MAEDLVKASEFGNFNNKGETEDTVIVVQRLLNIFRQLHIFNDKKREQFNQMILDLSDDVRSKLTAIPGGTLLKEYAEELEAKKGISRKTDDTKVIDENDEDVIKARIFAQALAEAQAKFNPPAPQTIQQAPVFIPINDENTKLQERLGAVQKAMQAAKAASDEAKLAELQKESVLIQNKLKSSGIANAPALTPNISGDLKVVADKAFAKEMADALAQAMKSIEINTVGGTSSGASSEELLSGIMKFSEESRQKNLEEITKTISESQIKLAQMMIENNKSNVVRIEGSEDGVMQAPMMAMPPIEDIISGVVKAQTEQLSNMISKALIESHKLSTQTMVEALSGLQKENLKLMEIQAKNSEIKAQTVAKETVVKEAPKPVVQEAPKGVKPQIKKEISNAGLDNSLFDIDDLETPNDGKVNTRNIGEMTEQAKDFVIEKAPEKVEPKVSKVFENPIPVRPEQVEEPTAPAEAVVEKPKEPVASPTPKAEPQPVVEDEKGEEEWEWQDPKETADTAELEVKPGFSEDKDVATDDDPENGFIVYEPHEDESQLLNRTNDTEEEEGGQAFEFKVMDDVQNAAAELPEEETAEEAPQTNEDDGEWEWEYEEAGENGEAAGNEDGEWEWEYEEVDESAQQ